MVNKDVYKDVYKEVRLYLNVSVNIEVAVDAFCVLSMASGLTPGFTSSLHNNTDVCANVCMFSIFFLLPVLLYKLCINKKQLEGDSIKCNRSNGPTALRLWLSGARTVR